MGRRDVPPREHRKPSKNARKEAISDLIPASLPPAVEVIRRKRKEQVEEE